MKTSPAKTITSLLIIFFAALSFQVNGKPPPNVELANDQVLHRGNGAEPHALDPQIAEGVPSSNIQRDLFEGLISEKPTGELIPGAAERWEVSEDGKQYIFHIRQDANWSNGAPLTAHDFVFSWQRLVNPATASNYALMLGPVENAEAIIRGDMPPSSLGVQALDDKTLQVKLRSPTPYFLGVMTHATTYPVYSPALEEHGDRFTRPGNLVSNGAFVLAEWRVQSHIKVVRNPEYWDNENTTLETVYFYPTEDLNAEVLRYRAGELDLTYQLPVGQMDWLRRNLPDELHIVPYLGVYYYGFNLSRHPFDEAPAELRQALSMAIDREIITDKVLQDGSLPAYSWVPPGTLDYEGKEYQWIKHSREERLAKARELYREAGYSEDKPLRLELRYNTHENHKKIALAVAAMWKQNLGVITEIINQEWKVFIDVVNQEHITQVYRAGWIGDYNDAFTFLELGLSHNAQNNTGYHSVKFDSLVEQSITAKSKEERLALLQSAERTMLEDYPYIPIYHYTTKRLVKPHVGGYENNIMDHQYSKYYYIKAH